MNILIVGSGGREHALAWKIAKSSKVDKLYCAPGNGGIEDICTCIDIKVTDFKALANFAKKTKVDLTVVGPEMPLALGIVDYFNDRGLTIFGPDKKAAEIESSKSYAKYIMKKYNVPTAKYTLYTNYKDAENGIHSMIPPFVLKADGLAAGKGVIICKNRNEAYDALDMIMKEKKFGDAGNKLIIEEYLEGEEASVLAVTDGNDFILLPNSQDHKNIFEGDTGPNTGGMGAYAPAPVLDERILKVVKNKIIGPVIEGLYKEGRPYKGVLYAGLTITSRGPKVLEFNCRFGDPEVQAVLPLIDSDIVDLFMSSINDDIFNYNLQVLNKAAVCVVMSSGGYPGEYEKGMVINGLKEIEPEKDIVIFHAGTRKKGKNIVTSGGRVLGVTAVDETIKIAVDKAYKAIGSITFNGAYYRRDIAFKALM